MENAELKPIVEAMIFVAEEPISDIAIAVALAEDGVERPQVKAALEEIQRDWNENPARGMQLACIAGGYQFRTKESHAAVLQRLQVPRPMRLTGPSLETLAIVAYRQPIVRSEIEDIRGVDSGGVLKTLLDRGLVRIVGRRDEPGQPLLYGTTKRFLEIFSLKALSDLPSLKDIDSLLREHRSHTIEGEANQAGEVPTGEGEAPSLESDGAMGIIHRHPLDEDVEEERKDMEALSELEESLKDLRRLERTMFPKPVPKIDLNAEGGQDARPQGDGGENTAAGPMAAGIDDGLGEEGSDAEEDPFGPTLAVEEPAAPDAAPEDDRPLH